MIALTCRRMIALICVNTRELRQRFRLTACPRVRAKSYGSDVLLEKKADFCVSTASTPLCGLIAWRRVIGAELTMLTALIVFLGLPLKTFSILASF